MSPRALRSALQKEEELELSVKGRRSGKHISRPVWFVMKGDRVLLLPVEGSATNWYKNILKGPAVTISLADHSLSAKAKPITDQKRVREVVKLFEQKYGRDEIRKWYSKLDVAAEVHVS